VAAHDVRKGPHRQSATISSWIGPRAGSTLSAMIAASMAADEGWSRSNRQLAGPARMMLLIGRSRTDLYHSPQVTRTTSPNLGSRSFTHALRRTRWGEIAVFCRLIVIFVRAHAENASGRMGVLAIEWGE